VVTLAVSPEPARAIKAVAIRKYGGPEVLEYTELPAPTPKDNEVVIRVHASNVNPIDWKIREGMLKMFIRAPFPIVLGVDLAGVIVDVGSAVRELEVGDEVFAMMPRDIGAQAELVALAADVVVRKPKTMTMLEAGSVPSAALTALQSLRDRGKLAPGQRVLINGASGGVGLFAVQLAQVLGAHVTAVCGTSSFELVKRLGADRVIDYKTTDFTREDETYHVVFDAVGSRSPKQCKRVVVRGGAYVSTGGTPRLFLRQFLNFMFSLKVHAILVKSVGADLEYLRTLIDKGKLVTVIDKVFPIAQIVDAQAYSATGRAKGKIVLDFTARQRDLPS
jgi:NADPH:quinone reductase-like Zn-dependent oxidoreductase